MRHPENVIKDLAEIGFELETERDRLKVINADLLAALENMGLLIESNPLLSATASCILPQGRAAIAKARGK